MRELFEDEKRWTKGDSAKDITGHWINPLSDEAVCWCLSGGLRVVYWDSTKLRQVEETLLKLCDGSIPAWNDDPARTIDDVRRLVKEAGV